MSRWILHSESTFTASHALTSYLGEPEESHEHQWRVAIQVGTDQLHSEGYALDFHLVHALLAEATEPLDGTELNQHPVVGTPSPTAERVAEVLAEDLGPKCEEIGGTLLMVSVWEGPDNRVDLVIEDSSSSRWKNRRSRR
jgi:6-pyruvoyl-tetrahydropterin synthase